MKHYPVIAEIPRLMLEWDFEKNSEFDPTEIRSHSDRKVWWKCVNGHSYLQAAKSHAAGAGCPYCSGKLVLPGYNDLYTANPEFLKEWDIAKNLPLTPANLRLHSNKYVWWKCEKGHSWRISVQHRAQGNGCPYCSGRMVLVGYNDLASVAPDIAGQWDYEKNNDLTPQMVTAGSQRQIWWKCSAGHSWKAAVYTRKKYGCPFCAGRRLLTGFNDLLTVRPDLAAQWDYEKNQGLLPEQVTSCSAQKVWWHCELGHSWPAQIANRTYGTGCPYCSGRRPIIGETDLKSQHPELLCLWDDLMNKGTVPENVTCGSEKLIWWKCEKNHRWQARVADVVQGSRCPYCAGRKVLIGFNDLKTALPDIAAQWDYDKNQNLRPEHFTPCSRKKVWWKCANGHSWQIGIDHRKAGTDCPYCSGNRVIPGETDLLTLAPDIAKQWDFERNGKLKPQNVSPGSNKRVWWKCSLHHTWAACVFDRVRGTGCPYCKGKFPIPGETDLAAVSPELAAQWDDKKNGLLTPEKVTAHSNSRVWWRCGNGHSWRAVINDRSQGAGCPYCAGKTPMHTKFVT